MESIQPLNGRSTNGSREKLDGFTSYRLGYQVRFGNGIETDKSDHSGLDGSDSTPVPGKRCPAD
jgi:hypothetical protein